MATQDWSTKDISLAKEHFIGGLTVKDIAKRLGRTPSSTNKALTRFGIRLKNPRLNSPKIPKTEIKVRILGFDRKSLCKQLDNWVSFWKVCDFLATQKIGIFEQSTYGTPLGQRKFLIGHQTYGASQVLLMANKIRVEKDQPAFLVDGLSW